MSLVVSSEAFIFDCQLPDSKVFNHERKHVSSFNKELKVQTSAVGLSTFLAPSQPLVLLQPVHAAVAATPLDLALGACPDCQRAEPCEADAGRHALGRQRCSTRALRGS